MTYNYTGKVINILPVEDIRSQSQTFTRKQTIICEEKKNKCAFLLFDDKIETLQLLGIQVGDEINICFSIKARIYKGEWYSNAYCLTIEKKIKYQKKERPKWTYNDPKMKNFWENFGTFTDSTQQRKSKWFDGCISDDDYKKRYRQLSKKYHPDMPDGDIVKMQEINIEYEKYKV